MERREVVSLKDEREKRAPDPSRFWKIRLPGECFWVRDAVRYGGLWEAIVENALIEHPYKTGDRVLFAEEQIIRRSAGETP